MTKTTFYAVAAVFWLMIAAVVYSSFDSISGQFASEEDTGVITALVVIVVGFILGLGFTTMISDKVCESFGAGSDLSALSPEKRARIAEDQARQALEIGNARGAIVALENGGLLDRAIELAIEKNEHALAGRLFLRTGRKEQARKAYVRAGDHLMAGHLSLAVKDYRAAKEYYGLYVDGQGESFKPR